MSALGGSQGLCAVQIHARSGVDPTCFSGSGPTHFFRSWVRICIGSTHFLRLVVYFCVCIQHDIDKSQISSIELCKTLRTNSGLRAINSCLHLFWPQLCKACWVNIVLWQQNLKFSFHQQTVEFGPTHIFTHIFWHHRSWTVPERSGFFPRHLSGIPRWSFGGVA